MIRSKRGFVGLSITQTIGLVLAFMFIIMSVIVISNMLNIFTGPADQGTIAMYNRMHDAVEVMINPSNEHGACKIIPGYIKPNLAIVGFNNEANTRTDDGQGYIEEYCGIIAHNVHKPNTCLDRSCLCLCNGGSGDITGDDCSESEAICRRFDPQLHKFTTRINNDVKDLVLYGENCWGFDNEVIEGYVLFRQGSGIEIYAVMESEDMDRFSDVPQCEMIVRDFRRGEARPEGEQEDGGDQGDDNELDESIAVVRSRGSEQAD